MEAARSRVLDLLEPIQQVPLSLLIAVALFTIVSFALVVSSPGHLTCLTASLTLSTALPRPLHRRSRPTDTAQVRKGVHNRIARWVDQQARITAMLVR